MTTLPKILVIDDEFGCATEDSLRSSFCYTTKINDITGDLKKQEFPSSTAEAVFIQGQKMVDGCVENDIEGVISTIKNGWKKSPRWAMVLLDMHFKTGKTNDNGVPAGRESDRDPNNYFGLKILNAISNDKSLLDLPIIVLSSMEKEKIVNIYGLLNTLEFVDKTEITEQKLNELIYLYGLIQDKNIIGTSIPILKCLREARVRTCTKNDTNILLLGETGTGKEPFSKYIFENAVKNGWKKKFKRVELLGVPEDLIDDMIFGHDVSAFTGATTAKEGPAEIADGGVLFLDEFGDISPMVIPKLLRLLDETTRETQRLGTKADAKKVKLMIVLATERMDVLYNQDYRSAMLGRINANHPIFLPPLRERVEDIELLANHFLTKYDMKNRTLSQSAISWIKQYPWYLNVRELEGAIKQLLISLPGIDMFEENHFEQLVLTKTNLINKYKKETTDAKLDTTEKLPETSQGQIIIESTQHVDFKDLLKNYNFSNLSSDDMRNSYTNIQEFVIKYIIRAIDINRDLNDNEINILGAIRFMTGDDNFSATQAIRLLRKLFKVNQKGLENLDNKTISEIQERIN